MHRFETFPAWIVEQGLKGLPLDAQFHEFCQKLVETGFPVVRASMAVATLHPTYGAHTFIWTRGSTSAQHIPRERNLEARAQFRSSPIYYLRRSGTRSLHERLDGNEPLRFPILEELRQDGMTDFAARIVEYRDDLTGTDPALPAAFEGVYFSFATNFSGGFSGDALADLGGVLPYLAMAIKSRLTYDVASTVLSTYLGEDAGQQVLTGRIERGAVESIRSVIWLCDLRGYTRTTDALPRDELVETLDDHLEVMARPLQDNGGQILKFLGDGFLATFNLSGLPDESVCSNALKAAGDLRRDFAAFKAGRLAQGKPVMDFGLALHLGEVLYGNIGSGDRLDFTVIGPAVNEASRIEQLCRPLGRDIIISSTFHKSATNCRGLMMSLGSHELRDVARPQDLYTLIPV